MLLSALKRMALAAIDPRYEAKEKELANLRAAAQQSGSIQSGQWYRLLGADGGLQGFSFYCCQQYQLRDVNLWLRVHHCLQCKTRLSVLEAAGIKQGTPPEQWPERFMHLPVQPQKLEAKAPGNFQDTWAVGLDEVGYELADPFAVSKQK